MVLLGWTYLEAEKRFHLVFDASGSYGSISGYTQTPLGGVPSSTSDKRPKFDELGIDTMTMVNLSLSGGVGPHSIHGAAHLVDVSGGRVAIRGHVMEPERTHPKECSLFAVNMLIGTRGEGGPNTYNEIKDGLLEAGFAFIRLRRKRERINVLGEAFKP